MTLLTSAECREIAERKMVEAEGDPVHFKSDPWRTSSPLHPNLGFRYTPWHLIRSAIATI
jgi:hypothetical protein